MILLNGEWILKETYVEIETVMMYKRDIDCINFGNIIIDWCWFQVDGATVVHLFCLKFDKLKLVLDFFEVEKWYYLTSILVKNKYGVTPL